MGLISLDLPGRDQAQGLLAGLAGRRPEVGPQPADRPLVLYGAGKMGRLAAELMAFLGIPVAYAIDRSPPEDRLLLGRIPVYRPEEAPSADHASHLVAVCVVLAPYELIRASLTEMGWRHVTPFYDVAEAYTGRAPLNNGWFAGPLDDEDQARIGQVLEKWDDDCSRAAHLQFLAWRVHREEWKFDGAAVDTENRYFIPPLLRVLGAEEYFLDAGAWHGVVTQRFLSETRGRFKQIVAVEADRDNARQLREWVRGLDSEVQRRIQIQEVALAETDGEQPFAHGHDLASRLMADASGTVATRSLDKLNIPFTFAKIHLEGGELAALRGGLETLQKHRPILAITVYHNRDGLWRIPAFLMGCLPDYRFLLRLHAWCGTGAVLYALPGERACRV